MRKNVCKVCEECMCVEDEGNRIEKVNGVFVCEACIEERISVPGRKRVKTYVID